MAHIYMAEGGGGLASWLGLFLPETDTCLTARLLWGIKTAQVKRSKERKANIATVKSKMLWRGKKTQGAKYSDTTNKLHYK